MAELPSATPTPGANEGGQPPAQTPAQQPGTPAPAPIILSQEQFDQRFGERMTNLEKELGLEPGAFKNPTALKERLGQKKPPAPAPTGETLSGADLKIARMEALMTAGVPSKQIPLLLQHLNISGKTREEIQASIGQLIELKLLTIEAPAQNPGNQQQPNQPPNAAQGAGNPGVSGAAPAAKIWKESEIRELRLSGKMAEAQLADIKKAAEEGRIQ